MAEAGKIRFGVIGPGGAGRGRTFALNRDKAVEVVAATDTSPECIDKLEEGLGHKVDCKLPRGYPENPCDNFAKLCTGRTKDNHVPALFGAQVALLTDGMLQAGRTGRLANCEAILKKAGYTYKDLKLR